MFGRRRGKQILMWAAVGLTVASLAQFVEAHRVDVAAVKPPRLRAYLKQALAKA